MKVHKPYTDPLRLYRQGFDITEYTAFQNYTADGSEIAVGLRDEIYRKPDNEVSIDFGNICGLLSFVICVSQRRFYGITTWMTRDARDMLIVQE